MAERDSLPKSTAEALQAVNPSVSPQASQSNKLNYMQRPPTILPNYGKRWKHGRTLKTNMPRVLLYDNVTQQAILDAQVSYIQSQRGKTRRHLDMNIKSFRLWKERKEKALHKLTKVQHDHDYAHFELEYYGRFVHTDKILLGKCSNRLGLSNIRDENQGGKAVTTSRGDMCKQDERDRLPALSAVLKTEGRQKLSGVSSYSAKQNQNVNEINLPKITNLSSPKTSKNIGHQENSVLRTVQQRNRKLQFKDNSPEIVKSIEPVFCNHIIPQQQVSKDKQISMKPPMHNINNSTKKSDDNELNHNEHTSMKPPTNNITNSTNSTDDHALTSGVDTAKTNLEKQSMDISNIIMHTNSKNFLKHKQDKKKGPVFDNRFLQLHNILIRQCPPSEGFTVLSPSFKEKKSFHYEK